MPSTGASVRMAWATPIDVVNLCANLDAYRKTKPLFVMLRLCNAFGQGPLVSVTRLPKELLTHIEGYIIEEAREREREKWASYYKCWRNECTTLDHYDADDLQDEWQQRFPLEPTDSPIDMSRLVDRLVRDTEWIEEHNATVYTWREWVGDYGRRDFHTGISLFQRHLLEDFGLDLWVSQIQRKQRVTATYLTLPQSDRFEYAADFLTTYEEHDDDLWDGKGNPAEDGIAMPIIMPGPLSAADRSKFSRAMRVLDLKISTKDCYHDRMLAATDADAMGKEDELGPGNTPVKTGRLTDAALWPKVLLLLQVAGDSA